MIKAVIFDWGGVLIKFPPNQTVKYWAKYLGINNLKLKLFYEQHKKELWKGTLTQEKFFNLVAEKFNCAKPRRSVCLKIHSTKLIANKKKSLILPRKLKRKAIDWP